MLTQLAQSKQHMLGGLFGLRYYHESYFAYFVYIYKLNKLVYS